VRRWPRVRRTLRAPDPRPRHAPVAASAVMTRRGTDFAIRPGESEAVELVAPRSPPTRVHKVPHFPLGPPRGRICRSTVLISTNRRGDWEVCEVLARPEPHVRPHPGPRVRQPRPAHAAEQGDELHVERARQRAASQSTDRHLGQPAAATRPDTEALPSPRAPTPRPTGRRAPRRHRARTARAPRPPPFRAKSPKRAGSLTSRAVLCKARGLK
jgi:hypothetical protein